MDHVVEEGPTAGEPGVGEPVPSDRQLSVVGAAECYDLAEQAGLVASQQISADRQEPNRVRDEKRDIVSADSVGDGSGVVGRRSERLLAQDRRPRRGGSLD